jgi:hypothetical protein
VTIPWGELRSALAYASAGERQPLSALLKTLPKGEEHQQALGSYLEGGVRQDPSLLLGWPMEIWGVPVADLLKDCGQPGREITWLTSFLGACLRTNKRAVLPLRPLFLEPVSALPEGWDLPIWQETHRALAGVRDMVHYQMVALPETHGWRQAYREEHLGFGARVRELFIQVTSDLIHNPLGFDPAACRVKLQEACSVLLAADRALPRGRTLAPEQFLAVAGGALENGASNLASLILVFRLTAHWGADKMMPPPYEPERLLEEACARLYLQAWELSATGGPGYQPPAPFAGCWRGSCLEVP